MTLISRPCVEPSLIVCVLCAVRVSTTIMSKREADETVAVEENGSKKQKVEEWVVPEKFKQVKEELACQPWNPEVTSVQDLITDVISKASTDAFFVAGMYIWLFQSELFPKIPRPVYT